MPFAVIDMMHDVSIPEKDRSNMASGKVDRFRVSEEYDINSIETQAVFTILERAQHFCDELNKKEYSYQRAAAEAMKVQDACNLRGVSRAYIKALHAVERQAAIENKGTDWINEHPIMVSFIDKMNCLCRNNTANAMKAYDACEAIASQPVADSDKG